MCFITILLRKCQEEVRFARGFCGGLDRKYETASGWSGSRLFIFWLKSAQKRKEAKRKIQEQDEAAKMAGEGGT